MQGEIIHFDALTRCGLLRDRAGQIHYFQQTDAHALPAPAAGQSVEFTLLSDNSLKLMPTNAADSDRQTIAQPASPNRVPVAVPQAEVIAGDTGPGFRFMNWPGALVSALALVSLVAGGREKALLESLWGIGAAVLLAIQTIFFWTGARRSRLRSNFWRILLCSLVAYGVQSCDGFEPDFAARAYGYTLIALFVVVYLLPHRSEG